jgi:hypothetical protein
MENPASTTLSTNDDDESIAADRLRGARAISIERGESVHQVYKAFAQGRLPGAWKDGGVIYASKRAMRRAHHAKARSGSK